MKLFKMSALALATTLALTGCGSDGNDSGVTTPNTPSTPTKPPVDDTLSELEQAKEMIRTAKLFVSDNHAVKTAYENASEILSSKQQSRVSDGLDVPANIYYYMKEKGLAKMTSADISKLANDEDFNNALNRTLITPSSDFIATLSADGQFALSGTTVVNTVEVDYGSYNPQTGGYGTVATDTFTAVYDGYSDALSSNTPTDNFKGSFGFKSVTVGSGAEKVVLSAGKNGAKVNAKFSDKVVMNDEFDLGDLQEAGITLEKAVATLDNVKLIANDSTIEARNLKLGMMDITNKLADGTTAIRTIPYEFALTGQLTKASPVTDVTITLNVVANETDLKNVLVLTSEDKVEEKAGKFVGMDVLLAIKGNVTKENATTIPLDFQAKLNRSARDVITLKGLTAMVEGKTLFVKGQSDLDADYNVKSTTLVVEQNNAHLTLKMDANNDFITDANGKLADIMVGTKDFGDLMDNNGKITAKFSDNSLIVL